MECLVTRLMGDNGREADFLAIFKAGEMKDQGFDRTISLPAVQKSQTGIPVGGSMVRGESQ